MKISSKKLASLLFSIIVLLVAYFFQTSPQETKADENKDFYEIAKVADGDTLTVWINNEKVGVRLIGLNTPETIDPRKAVQCFGKEASNQAKTMLSGKRVRLGIDSSQDDKDKYGRLLRYIFLEDGTLFNKWMIENGFGFEYTYDSNPYEYQVEFQTAESLARENKRGLWAETACNGQLKDN
jgi:micrococcal nuclease